MPRKKRLELHWHKATKRWRKRYKGKDYYFKFGKSKTDMEGYSQALEAWRKKKDELEDNEYEPHKRKWEEVLSVAQFHRHNTSSEMVQQLSEDFVAIARERIAGRYKFPGCDAPGGNAPDADETVTPPWELPEYRKEVSKVKTVREAVDDFLGRKEAQALNGERSAGRYGSLRRCLEDFVEWYGGRKPVEEINSKTLLDWHTHLLKQIAKGMTRAYARDHMQAVKQFIRNAWELELLELPRNLQSKDLEIRLPATKVEVFEVDELKHLLDNTNDRLRLWLLLMANCGMQQKDIADLQQAEVDWENGRLKRKRSKTGDKDSVPEVDYLLWPQTFELLTKLRSNHPDLALTNRTGKPLWMENIKNGKEQRTDAIRSAYFRLVRKLEIPKPKALKLIRKTSASMLEDHDTFGRYAQYFLGQSPDSVASKHYVRPSKEQFDKAVIWLGKQYGMIKEAAQNGRPHGVP